MADVVHPPQEVADVFVKQYYTILSRSPENTHKFYAETSLLGWPDRNGVMTHVTTLSSINDKIMACDYKNCDAEINTVDAQASHDEGVMVTVTGSFLEKSKVKYLFFHNFYLARQAKGFFIKNDVLRVFYACESVADDAPTPCALCAASDISVLEDTVAKVSSSASLVASAEKVPPVVEPTSNAEVASVVPATSANVPSCVEPSASANVSPAVAPAAKGSAPSAVAQADKESAPSAEAPANKGSAPSTVAPAGKDSAPASVAQAGKENVKPVIVKPVVATASNLAPKTTYASLVAQTIPATSPKAAPEAPKVAPVPKKVAPVSQKAAPLPLANGVPKATAPALANGEPKATTKSMTGGNSAPNAFPDARSIYVGKLPLGVTKFQISEALRKFGPVRRYGDAVQIRRHDDGFCCAFVDFESPDSARLAVEARNVSFGGVLSFVTYKKSTRGSRSPTRGGYQNGNGNQSNQSRFVEQSRSSSQGAR